MIPLKFLFQFNLKSLKFDSTHNLSLPSLSFALTHTHTRTIHVEQQKGRNHYFSILNTWLNNTLLNNNLPPSKPLYFIHVCARLCARVYKCVC